MRRGPIQLLEVLLAGLFFLLLSAGSAPADTITLKDGQVIQGQLVRQGDSFLVQPDQGADFAIPISDVGKIVLSRSKNPQQEAIDQWEYIQFTITQQNDLPQIISTIQTYLKKYPNSPKLNDAQALLMQYTRYKAQSYIKYGGNWMTPNECNEAQQQVQTLVNGSIKSIHAGAPAQALDEARKALVINPGDGDAMIIAGVAEYSQGHRQDALTWFNKLLNQDPQNIIALNDAGVVSFALNINLQPRALVCYQTALNLASGNRMLLDNVAAALEDYQGNTSSFLYKKLVQSFNSADQQMQVIMAQQGLYRFGGTWVNAVQKNQLDSQRMAYELQKNTLEANYDIALVVLQGISAQLNIVDQQINLLNQSIAPLQTQINNGQTYSIGPYGWYYDNTAGSVALLNEYLSELTQAQQTQVQLLTQQIQYQAQIKNIQSAAQQLIQAGEAMGFNGVQAMMLPGDLINVPPPLPLSMLGQLRNPPPGN
jgi:tetratricopeptide (TPR) repeat protein